MKLTWIRLTACLLLVWSVSPVGLACNYAGKMRTYQRLLAKWTVNPNMNNSDRLCRAIKRIDCKFKNKPGKPTPPTPAGLACPPKGNGGGRGGGPLSIIVGIGAGPIASTGWVRNHYGSETVYEFAITPAPGNPAGFSVSPTSGQIPVPAGSTATVDFDVTVSGAAAPGAIAFFDIVWTDPVTNLPLADEFQSFQVTADSEVSVIPVMPMHFATPGLPTSVAWSVTNHTGSTVTRPFTYFWQGDPASVAELNSGAPYDIKNMFPADKTAPAGGSVTVGPGETEIIMKDDFLPGEFCDPEMIGCCGLDLGGSSCCALIANDDFGPPFRTLMPFYDLLGNPTGIGDIGFNINGFQALVPSNAAPTVPELLDLLAQQTLNLADNQNGFNFMPMVDETGFMLLFPMELPFQFQLFSTDPGMQWQPDLPLVFPDAAGWLGGPNDLLGLVEIVNGWRLPQQP